LVWKGDRALSGDDIPQILNVAGTYELPFGTGKALAVHSNGISRLLVEGRKVSGNFMRKVEFRAASTDPALF